MKWLFLLFLVACNVGKEASRTPASADVYEEEPVSVNISNPTGSIPENGGAISITMSLSGRAPEDAILTYVVGGSATSGVDITGVTGTIDIDAGDTSAVVTLNVVDDSIYEGTETLVFTLTNSDSDLVQLGSSLQKQMSIYDNDAAPELNFALASTSSPVEGTDGSIDIDYTLSLASANVITFTLSKSGDAVSGSDYTLASTFTIPAGTTTGTITVTIPDDSFNEGSEDVQFVFANPRGATIGDDNSHSFTITDDEAPAPPEVEFTLATDTTIETNGDYYKSVEVSVNGTLETSQTVTYKINASATTATTSLDYVLNSTGTVTLAAGVNPTANIQVLIKGDTKFETDQDISLSLISTGLLVVSGNASHVLTIEDNDSEPTIDFSLASKSVTESQTQTFITVSLNETAGVDVTGTINTAGGTATVNTDYLFPSVAFTIPAGSLSVNIPFTAIRDLLDEVDETFDITIAAATNADEAGASTMTVTIVDNDVQPQIGFSTNFQTENDPSTSNDHQVVTVTVQLTGASGKNITVPYTVGGTATISSGATTTTNGVVTYDNACADNTHAEDHNLGDGEVQIAAGATSATISFTVCDDNWYDPAETIEIELGVPTNSTVSSGAGSHTVAVIDADDVPVVTFTQPTSNPDEGDGLETFTLSLDNLSQNPITVPILNMGSATSGTDYILNSSTVTIASGDLAEDFTLTLTDDVLLEEDETVALTIGNSLSGATVGATATHTLTISDNEAIPEIAFSAASQTVAEDQGIVSVTLQLNSAVTCYTDLTLGFNPVNNISAEVGDHDLSSVIMSFIAGATSSTFGFNIIDDSISETADGADESMSIQITSASCGSIPLTIGAVATHTVSITDNDPLPKISYSTPTASVLESAGIATIQIVLDRPSDEIINFDSEIDQTLTSGVPNTEYDYASWDITDAEDFTTPTGSPTYKEAITIAAGDQSATYNLTIVNDAAFELDEILRLNIDGEDPTEADIGSDSVDVTILNDDDPPYVHLTFGATAVIDSVNDSDENVAAVAFNVVLLDSSSLTTGTLVTSSRVPVDITLNTLGDVTALDGSVDDDTLTIAPGTSSIAGGITVTEDALYENDEEMIISLGNVDNANLGLGTDITHTINDNDTQPEITLSATGGVSFDENAGTVTFSFLRHPVGFSSSVTYTLTTSTATSSDHTLAAATITFDADSETMDSTNDDIYEEISFAITDDTLTEAQETIVIHISASNGYDITPAPADLTLFINASDQFQLASGSSHTCGLFSGEVKCWGIGSYLGRESATSYGLSASELVEDLDPIDLGSSFTPSKIIATSSSTCALSSTGSVKCWGSGLEGLLGSGSTATIGDGTGEMGDNLATIPIGFTVSDISAGTHHVCALSSAGAVKCWGNNLKGQLGQVRSSSDCATASNDGCIGDSSGEIASISSITFPDGKLARKIATGAYHSCAELDDGEVYCWGRGAEGQRGIGSTDYGDGTGEMSDDTGLLPVDLPVGDIKEIKAAGNNTCAILTNAGVDSLICWGEGVYGANGRGVATNFGDTAGELTSGSAVINLNGITSLSSLSMGAVDSDGTHVCFLDLANDVPRCFGNNSEGQLGLDLATNALIGDTEAVINSTYDVTDATGATAVYAGGTSTCAVIGADQFLCWGNNSFGQLGMGSIATEVGTNASLMSTITVSDF